MKIPLMKTTLKGGEKIMNKKVFLILPIFAILAGGLLFSTKAIAEGNNNSSSLVQKIADKFGLKKEDVQTVFDQERQDRQAEMQAKYKSQLDQFVKDGKITEDQKQLILAKHKELQASRQSNMGSMRNLTVEERKTAMEKQKSDLESWAKEKGIDIQYVTGFGFGMKGHGGHGGFGAPQK